MVAYVGSRCRGSSAGSSLGLSRVGVEQASGIAGLLLCSCHASSLCGGFDEFGVRKTTAKYLMHTAVGFTRRLSFNPDRQQPMSHQVQIPGGLERTPPWWLDISCCCVDLAFNGFDEVIFRYSLEVALSRSSTLRTSILSTRKRKFRNGSITLCSKKGRLRACEPCWVMLCCVM